MVCAVLCFYSMCALCIHLCGTVSESEFHQIKLGWKHFTFTEEKNEKKDVQCLFVHNKMNMTIPKAEIFE